MGQFSWKAQDTKRPIYNDNDEYFEEQTVYMVDPRDGTVYKEDAYEGYGIFGGRDFYELLAEMNGLVPVRKDWKNLTKDEIDDRRMEGIHLWFASIEPDGNTGGDKYKVKEFWSPILVEDLDNWERYNHPNYYPDSDPNQGWHTFDGDTDGMY